MQLPGEGIPVHGFARRRPSSSLLIVLVSAGFCEFRMHVKNNFMHIISYLNSDSDVQTVKDGRQ